MKSETCNALAALNRGFDLVLEALRVFQQDGLLPEGYVQDHTVPAEELRVGLNHMILEKLHAREVKDWATFGKMRVEIEARHRQV